MLTTLRFFAAMAVVLYHFDLLEGGKAGTLPLAGLWSAGYEAVSFFFILSGFVLVYALVDPRTGTLTGARRIFWQARAARIAPAYGLGLLVALPVLLQAVFLLGNVSLSHFVEAAILTPLALQAWWPPAATVWNFPGWSLSVEAFFYALFPFLVLARFDATRGLGLAWVLVLAAVIGRTFLSSLALDRFYESFPSFLLYFPLFHLPKFLFGMALGKFFTERRPPAMVCVALFWASALTLLALFVARPLLPTWIFNDAILSPLHACLIVGAAGGGAPRLLELPFLVLLGEASYAIYILHAPLEFYWHALATSSLSVVPATLSYCLFVVAFALLAHRFIERPLRRSLIKVLGR